MSDVIRISECKDWIVDYDKERGMYRVSYFEDCHFVDEYWFDCYEEKEVTNKTELIDINEKSRKNEDLANVLRKREFAAKENGDLKEAQFLMNVRHRVELGIAMEHDESTREICPRCQKPMEIKHGVFCQYCGQLVK